MRVANRRQWPWRLTAAWVIASLGALSATDRPPRVARCACCAERGTWYEESRKVTPEELAEIGRLNPAGEAHLYLTAAGIEDVAGIASPAEMYVVARTTRTRQWRLEFTAANGRRGALTFEIPERGTFFGVDQQPRSPSPADVALYKEWRLGGSASGSGDFSGGNYRFILQGTGNECPNAGDFASWILQVSGPRVQYSLYGRFASPTPRPGAGRRGLFAAAGHEPTRIHRISSGENELGDLQPGQWRELP